MFIRSERLFLRPGFPEDAADLTALLRAPLKTNVGLDAVPDLAVDPASALCHDRGPRLPGFLMTLPSAEGSRLIGAVGLGRDGGDVALGYLLAESHWGQGLAAEAARALLGLARVLGHARVIAHQFIDDRASLLVLTRAGFRATGEQRLRPRPGRGEALAAIYAADLAPLGACPIAGAETFRAA